MDNVTINVAGQFLDLERGFKISFKKENPLLQRKNIILERTTSFNIPPTPNNLAIFKLANRTDLYGEKVRRVYQAQIVANSVVINGALHIIKVDKKGNFSAVFVNVNKALAAMKGAKINERSLDKDFIYTLPPYGSLWYEYAPTAFILDQLEERRTIAHPYYSSITSKNRILFPSVNLWYLANKEIEAIFGLKVTGIRNYYIFQTFPTEVISIKEQASNIDIRYSGDRESWLQGYTIGSTSVGTQNIAVKLRDPATFSNVGTLTWGGFVFPQPVKVTLPVNLREDFFLVSVNNTADNYTKISDITFFGDYKFSMNEKANLVTEGQPIAGREIEVPANVPVFLINKNYYKTQYRGVAEELGFSININDYPTNVTLQPTTAAKEKSIKYPSGNGIMRVGDNLPKYSYIDLLFIYSWLTGKYFVPSEKSIDFYTPKAVDAMPVLDITDKVLSMEEIKREVLDFGQSNYIKYDANPNTPQRELLGNVDNDYIKPSSDVISLAGSKGNAGVVYDAVYNEGSKVWETADLQYGTFCIYGNPNTTANYPIWEAICNESTYVKVNVRYTLMQAQALPAEVVLLINGVRYLWTSYVWNEDVLTLELAKV